MTRRMNFDNKDRFCVLIDRLQRPGESLADASERLAKALHRDGYRGYIFTAGRGDMDPIGEGVNFSFGPDDDNAVEQSKGG